MTCNGSSATNNSSVTVTVPFNEETARYLESKGARFIPTTAEVATELLLKGSSEAATKKEKGINRREQRKAESAIAAEIASPENRVQIVAEKNGLLKNLLSVKKESRRAGLTQAARETINQKIADLKAKLKNLTSVEERIHKQMLEKANDNVAKEFREKLVDRHCAGCNNPGILATALKSCAGCSKVYYCSKECQKLNWKRHKPACKEVQENAAAAKSDNSNKADDKSNGENPTVLTNSIILTPQTSDFENRFVFLSLSNNYLMLTGQMFSAAIGIRELNGKLSNENQALVNSQLAIVDQCYEEMVTTLLEMKYLGKIRDNAKTAERFLQAAEIAISLAPAGTFPPSQEVAKLRFAAASDDLSRRLSHTITIVAK